ncbi:DUF2911 domain-containing protein [Agriterribacter sp.]|uniref:DUF2911 domain-containing protein n=1 Tax=Agriterribacter sp. TaxID=2821509 RepID=UPI002C6B3209|nr:DUF2911 domain-containing protein [Agriterribacter sp.]HRO46865.1 DUF2911 domain-containing protein [Agriterribacter sp.]HRQ18202.1 DUF2911 domain-containing protein [Agriterribacter sp.]
MTHSRCNLYGIVIIFIILLCTVLCACHTNPQSQTTPADSTVLPVPRQEGGNTLSLLDKSPLDIAYYPPEYPKLKMIGKAASLPVFRVIYSRPQKNGRKIFGSVVKYGEHWRLGANEATEIEIFGPVIIQQTKVPPGRYVLYCIPQPAEWTLILNSDLYSWGLIIDAAKDIFKFTVPTIPVPNPIEAFTIETGENEEGALLWIGWDDTKVVLPMQLNSK